MLIRSVWSGLTKLHHKKNKSTIARENCWTGPQNDGDWVPTHPLLQGATIPGRKSRSMLVTWWLLPSVLVLPPSLAVTLTYLPISPSPPMRKGAESTLWERIENTMKWKELENCKLETLLLSQYRFLVLSPHLNHFRPVEATANKFPDINKSRNRIPSFFYQILPGNDGGKSL